MIILGKCVIAGSGAPQAGSLMLYGTAQWGTTGKIAWRLDMTPKGGKSFQEWDKKMVASGSVGRGTARRRLLASCSQKSAATDDLSESKAGYAYRPSLVTPDRVRIPGRIPAACALALEGSRSAGLSDQQMHRK